MNSAKAPVATLRFDAEAHAYYLGAVRLPNVTTVMEEARLVDFSGSPEWAMLRGGRVHQAIHYDIDGDLDESSVDAGEWGYVRAALRWREDTGFTPRLVEHRIYHPTHLYAGTLDLEGSTINDTHVIVDWKAGGIQSGMGVQLAAYLVALAASASWPYARSPGQVCLYRRYTVQLLPSGEYRTKEWPREDLRKDFAAFQAALVLFRYRAEKGIIRWP